MDACVISHNHYDHLDRLSVLALHLRFPSAVWCGRAWWLPDCERRRFVGLGTRAWMVDVGVAAQQVVELDWWQEACGAPVRAVCDGVQHTLVKDGKTFTFAFTPAQHWCKRTATDTNKCLWGSWLVRGPTRRFFFAGAAAAPVDDSSLQATRRTARRLRRLGGATGRWTWLPSPSAHTSPGTHARHCTVVTSGSVVMQASHVNPAEAAQIHVDVRAVRSVGVHWGTFKLTHEHYLEPPRLLQRAAEALGLPTDAFFVLQHGQTATIDHPPCGEQHSA